MESSILKKNESTCQRYLPCLTWALEIYFEFCQQTKCTFSSVPHGTHFHIRLKIPLGNMLLLVYSLPTKGGKTSENCCEPCEDGTILVDTVKIQ